MNFINPYIEHYFHLRNSMYETIMPFSTEVYWLFLKNLNNRLKLFQHRVNINFVDMDVATSAYRSASIYSFNARFDHQSVKALNDSDKNAWLLDTVFEAFNALADEFNWDKEAITNAYRKSISEGLHFSYQTEVKQNRQKNKRGWLEMSLDRRILTIKVKIANKDSDQEITFDLLRTNEDNVSWWREIGKFGWLDNVRFGLKLHGGEMWITCNVDTLERETIFKAKNYTRKELERSLLELQKLPKQR
jgi:hypothetical protein